MLEAFEEFLDNLFWEGFSEYLQKNYPDRYSWELDNFLNIYK